MKSQNKIDLVGVQEVRWDRDSTESAGKYTFFYGRGEMRIMNLVQVFSYIRES
jgi:hypothetical protein